MPTTLDAALFANATYNDAITQGSTFNGATVILDQTFGLSGFRAVAFQLNTEVVVAYRGTDFGFSFDFLSDVIAGWTGAAITSPQSISAMEFYAEVLGMTNLPIVTTGHSLGGGLAGYVATLTEADAIVFDNMPFEFVSAQVLTMHAVMTAIEALGDTFAEAFANAAARPVSFFNDNLTMPGSLVGYGTPDAMSIIIEVDGEEAGTTRQVTVTRALYETLRDLSVTANLEGDSLPDIQGHAISLEVLSVLRLLQDAPVQSYSPFFGGDERADFSGLSDFLINLLPEPIDRHSMDLLTSTLYLETLPDSVQTDIGFLGGALIDALYDADLATTVGYDSAAEMFTAIAASAGNFTGTARTGSALDMMFNDAADAGQILDGAAYDFNFGFTTSDYAMRGALGDSVVQFAALVAESGATLEEGFLRAQGTRMISIDYSDTLWQRANGGAAVTTANIAGREDVIDRLDFDDYFGNVFNDGVELAMERLWGGASTDLFERVHYTYVSDAVTGAVNVDLATVDVSYGAFASSAGRGDVLTTTEFGDVITGSERNELLDAGDGSDTVEAGGGDDIIIGGDGTNYIDGGAGQDGVVFYENFSGITGDNFEIIELDAGNAYEFEILNLDTDEQTFVRNVQWAQFDADYYALSADSGANLISGLGGDAGFGEGILGRNDDGSSSAIDLTGVFENGLNFYGRTFTEFWVNNNGSVTFNGARSQFTPSVITQASNNPEITPFFADVDTAGGAVAATPGGNSTGSNLVYWDIDPLSDRIIVTWDDVGYYNDATDRLNAFQLVLEDRGGGNFDITFRYEDINWTTGNASGGNGGLGGTPARAGFTAGTGDPAAFFELPASGDQDAILALDEVNGNTGLVGIWEFNVRDGDITISDIPALPQDGLGGWTTGDPHLMTLDGVGYSFQAVGEYVLLRDTVGAGFEVQTRFVAEGNAVSITEAVATQVGSDTVMIDAGDNAASPLLINGQRVNMDDATSRALDGGRIYRVDDTYTIVYAGADAIVNNGDSRIIVSVLEDRVDLDIRLNAELLGDLEGLLGDGDGNPDNDVALADGTVLARPFAADDLYGTYRDDWRVSEASQTLFTYDNDETLAGFYDPDFPGVFVTLDMFDAADVAAAQQLVADAGLTAGTANFQNAVLDYLLTGDPSFIDSGTNVPVLPGSTLEQTEVPEDQDLLLGTTGADTLSAGEGDQSLIGLGGDDLMNGGIGADAFDGGAGIDTVSYEGSRGSLRVDLLFSQINTFWAAGDTFTGIENLIGSQGFDNLRGTFGDNLVQGMANVDYIFGRSGNDTLEGGIGDDVLLGGVGMDDLIGGENRDRAQYSEALTAVVASLADQSLNTGEAAGDTYTSIEDLAGTGLNDMLYGDSGDNRLFGRGGEDTLTAETGDDYLNGGGNRDTLIGGEGDDTLRGGNSRDTFVFDSGADVVEDWFLDTLQINTSMGAVAGLSGAQVINTFGDRTGADFVLDFGAGNSITLLGQADTTNALLQSYIEIA